MFRRILSREHEAEENSKLSPPVKRPKLDELTQIFVKDHNGKTLTMQVNLNLDTIESLANKIEARSGIPAHMQSISYRGKILYHTETLVHYGITKESTVFFSVRPPTESLCAKHQEVTVDELSRMLEPTIKSGHFYCTKHVVEMIPNPNYPYPTQTALELLVKHNIVELAEFFLTRNSSTIQYSNVIKALDIACEFNFYQCASTLLFFMKAKFADEMKIHPNLPLHTAARNGSVECLKLLLQCAPQADLEDADGETPLFEAMHHHQHATSWLLLQHGANPNYISGGGISPLAAYEKECMPRKKAKFDSSMESDFRFLLNNPNFSDVAFIVKGKTIYAHKAVLVSRAEYFRHMFLSNMKDSSTSVFHITDVEFEVYMGFMEFLYTNSVTICTKYLDILELADRYALEPLKILATELYAKTLNESNIIVSFEMILQLPLVEQRFPGLILKCCECIEAFWCSLVSNGTYKELTPEIVGLVAHLLDV